MARDKQHDDQQQKPKPKREGKAKAKAAESRTHHPKSTRGERRLALMVTRRNEKFAKYGIHIDKRDEEFVVWRDGRGEIGRTKSKRSALKRAHQYCRKMSHA